MDSWSLYGSEMKGSVLSDEMASPNDALSSSGKMIPSWDLKTPYNYNNNMPVLGHEAAERDLFMELGFSDGIRKSISDNTVRGVSCSLVDSNSHNSPLIDLKLGNLSDYRDCEDGKYAKEMRVYSSVVSAVPAKRSRPANLNAHIPFCQVLGCNMDLSSSKDYHKRHKVCDVHSKTAKVIVNGIEQRFCQQCSRFHLLAEFDEGKRSCRKRLAGHNERRRKPQLDNHSRKNGKLIPSYQGSRFLGTSLPARPSLLFPDMFPSVGLPEAKYENSNWSRHIKSENEEIYNTPSPVPITNEQLFPKPFNPLYGMDLTGSNSVSRSLFNSPSGNEEFTVFDTASNIQGVSGIPNSGCALSLLSSQSHNSSTRSPEVSMARPLIIQGEHSTAHNNMGLFPNKHFAASSQGSTNVKDDHLVTVLVSNPGNPIEFEVQANRFFQGFDFVNGKAPPTSNEQGGHTIDLLQLSSQLQRVEHERLPVQVKQENEVFCYLPAT